MEVDLSQPIVPLNVTKMQWLDYYSWEVWRGHSNKSGFIWVLVAERYPPVNEIEKCALRNRIVCPDLDADP
jgi:hypothetical protein